MSDDVLRAALERVLSEHFGTARHISSLERRPCAYRTSFPLEEIDVELDGGELLHLMRKDLGRDALSRAAAAAKPAFMHDPLREIVAYEILKPEALGTPVFYGSEVDRVHGRYRLFIERIDGDVLWQVGELETWVAAARWLAGLHARFRQESPGGAWQHLVQYDRAFYELWMERALGFARDATTGWDAHARATIEWLGERYEPVIERLLSLPATFIHGEFYPSNVLVGPLPGRRICPIDWEVAAVGPGLIDLAALTTGWTDDERRSIEDAYAGAGKSASGPEALAACRLHLAVQWLGWEASWTPPLEHRRDWVAEALCEARVLGLR